MKPSASRPWRKASTGGRLAYLAIRRDRQRRRRSDANHLPQPQFHPRLAAKLEAIGRSSPELVKILHFADAHIDMANYGRHDPETGLPLRVMDFLKSLDTIVDTAIEEQVDLVIFAGDAYKDRNPAPTFQREWGRRIMRLSRAGIPTLLLVGNHDLSPALRPGPRPGGLRHPGGAARAGAGQALLFSARTSWTACRCR